VFFRGGALGSTNKGGRPTTFSLATKAEALEWEEELLVEPMEPDGTIAWSAYLEICGLNSNKPGYYALRIAEVEWGWDTHAAHGNLRNIDRIGGGRGHGGPGDRGEWRVNKVALLARHRRHFKLDE